MLADYILKKILVFPNCLNNYLLQLNIFPEIIYGKKYRQLKNSNTNFNIEDRLLSIVNRAIEEVPYYRKCYGDIKINSLEQFRSTIGFINKSIVSNEFEKFISQSINKENYVFGTTGGTSGKPLKFLIPKNRYQIELSTIHNMWNRVGWNYHTRGVLRNHHLPENEIYKINPFTKEYIFDNFRLNHEYAKKVYLVLTKKKIKFIHAYPSAAYQFCQLCKEQSLDLSFIEAFLCGSEGILDFQRKLICEDLGIKVYSWYGHSEKLILGGYCEEMDYYHIEQQYGYFELIDDNNIPITEAGKVGEIVGTTLHNNGMPLIRYRTGDYAEYVDEHCEYCGRKTVIIKNIRGHRDENMIFKMDGTYITTTALNLHNELYTYIDGMQYIQEKKGELTILLIKNKYFKEEHEKLFLNHFSNSFGKENIINIKYVNNLILKPNGKFELLISYCNKYTR